MLDTFKIKKDFPIFNKIPDLIYLDSTATSLKPQSVIDAEDAYYKEYSANIFRGVYKISEKATQKYEDSRLAVAQFINAKSSDEIIFTRNTTESINLVAYSWGRTNIQKNDEIVTTILEHHSNFVPWQVLAMENNAVLKVIDVDNNGVLETDTLEQIITKKTKILTLTHISNVLGTILPIKKIIYQAKQINPHIVVLVDGAQAVPHIKIDVQDLGCDFYAFSGHKMLGPTGVGVLWGKSELLNAMPPFLFGGEMIREVHLDNTNYASIPHKFEAGTPHIAGVIGLKAAINYLQVTGLNNIHDHESELAQIAIKQLTYAFKDDVHILGTDNNRSGIVAFKFGKAHAHDVAQILDENNICVRAGHHCAMPLHERLAIQASVRASFYLYNSVEDIEQLILGLQQVKKILM
ncbi:MAG: SufS family cysteine desulfurase [bacterium]|nr:SufS family cysteine desulfurase [bacterium]